MIRNIERAGMVGRLSLGYGSEVKRVELKWAEKGPRRSGERGYGGRRSRCLTVPGSPLHEAHSHAAISNSNPPHSFIMGSPYSAMAHHSHYLPF